MDDKSPKVSIVLPTYNGSRYIRQSIDSCLGQTYENIELIIVDDASVDESPAIIRSYTDQRIRYIRHKRNKGLPHALNTGFAQASGEFLTWASDDNQYVPYAIKVMFDFLRQHNNADFVYADYWEYHLEKGEKKIRRLPDNFDLSEKCLTGGCFLYTRKVLKTIGRYDPKYRLVEDYDYWIRISKKFDLVHCPVPLNIYTYHSGSLTMTKSDLQVLFDRILRFENGYLSVSELGRAAWEFIEFNMYKKRRKDALHSFLNTGVRMYRVSFISGSVYFVLLGYFTIMKIVTFDFRKLFNASYYKQNNNEL
jgi:glycosyltransferase involved in cell wall biosynthesis